MKRAGVQMMRLFDIVIAGLGLIILSPILVFIFMIGLVDTGSPVFRQIRVGKLQQQFLLYKFRTMKVGTLSVASHLVDKESVTRVGLILRRSKMDELPQLWNVFIGDMSLVGPRPSLPSQREVIRERESLGVMNARPGITGLSQISGIDMSTPLLLAKTDRTMLDELSLFSYLKYILATLSGRGVGDSVRK